MRSSGILNGSSTTGVSNVPVAGRPAVERHAAAQRGRGRLGDPDGERPDAVRLGELEGVRRGEAPRAIDDDSDAEPIALAHRDALDAAALDRNRLVAAADDAHVGVGRAELGRGVEGAVGQVLHVGAGSVPEERAPERVLSLRRVLSLTGGPTPARP